MDVIQTNNAPKAIGTYSQAVKAGDWVYISGQIPLCPKAMVLVGEDIDKQLHQVFKNLSALCLAAGGNLSHIVKLTIYLTDLSCFDSVNSIMASYFAAPYPARAAVEVSALPKGAMVEMDAVLHLAG